MAKGIETGHVDYTKRALLQDAQEAMGGNIVRGLVELITNADDAYARLDKQQHGRIAVEVEHRRGTRWKVVVRDRATGMSREELKERITRLAARTSGFERGLSVRGNRGRGAKDLVAFGPVRFESVKGRQLAILELGQDGEWKLSSHGATDTVRKELGIKRNGTVVTLTASASVRCPHHDNLAEQLQCHFQLRDIMSAQNREVMLVNLTRSAKRRLHYGLDLESLEKVADDKLTIEGYPGAEAWLSVWRLPERCENPPSDPTRACGILIRGRRAIYDNTLFRFEGNPHSGSFAGTVICPFIDQLANEYDDCLDAGSELPASNQFPIITRRREGLAPNHPFTKALAAAVEPVLGGLVKEEEARQQRVGSIENEATRRNLEKMAREAARFLQEALREIEADEIPTGEWGDVEPLGIVPPEVAIAVGEERTLSVLAQAKGLSEGAEVFIGTEPDGVVDVLDGISIGLQRHKRRDDVFSGQIHLRGLIEGEALVTASIDGREAVGIVSVRPEETTEPPVEEPPEVLEFERRRYQVRWNKRKSLTLRAPAELIAKADASASIRSDDAGVVVLGGASVRLVVDDSTGIATGSVQIEGRTLGAKAKLTAEVTGTTCDCRVSVEQRDEGLPDLQIVLSPETPGVYRALFDPPEVAAGERQTLKVFALHGSLKGYLGDAPDYTGQESPAWRAVLAEVVTEAIVRRIVSQKYPAGSEGLDADRIYFDHLSYLSRLLPLMQRANLG